MGWYFFSANNPPHSPQYWRKRSSSSSVTTTADGCFHCASVIEGGKQQLWESNVFGQRGTGMAAGDVLAATRCDFGALAGADTLVAFVACSCFHTVVLTSDGGVIAFGSNPHGQLGTGNNNAQPTSERLTCAALAATSHIS